MSIKFKRYCSMYLATLLITILGLTNFQPLQTLAADKADLKDKVIVVRDGTEKSHCMWEEDGKLIPCPVGSVLLTFFVSESEAKSLGEAYIRISDDVVATNNAVDQLIERLRTEIRSETHKLSDNKPLFPFSTLATCGTNKTRTSSFQAYNFSGQPTISYTYTYNVSGSGCASLQATKIVTSIISNPNGTTINYDKSIYDSGTGNDDPGCPTSMPTSSGPRYFNISGTAGQYMTLTVENGCLFTARANGQVLLD